MSGVNQLVLFHIKEIEKTTGVLSFESRHFRMVSFLLLVVGETSLVYTSDVDSISARYWSVNSLFTFATRLLYYINQSSLFLLLQPNSESATASALVA